MKCYTTDTELHKLIVQMQSLRGKQDTWDVQDEQVFAFLLELECRRSLDNEIKELFNKGEKSISSLMDKLQDEKKMLIM